MEAGGSRGQSQQRQCTRGERRPHGARRQAQEASLPGRRPTGPPAAGTCSFGLRRWLANPIGPQLRALCWYLVCIWVSLDLVSIPKSGLVSCSPSSCVTLIKMKIPRLHPRPSGSGALGSALAIPLERF